MNTWTTSIVTRDFNAHINLRLPAISSKPLRQNPQSKLAKEFDAWVVSPLIQSTRFSSLLIICFDHLPLQTISCSKASTIRGQEENCMDESQGGKLQSYKCNISQTSKMSVTLVLMLLLYVRWQMLVHGAMFFFLWYIRMEGESLKILLLEWHQCVNMY